jgi:hypothetical protein
VSFYLVSSGFPILSEEINLEELEKELSELEQKPKESIEIKPEIVPKEEREERSAEELEEELRRVEEEKEKQELMKYGGVCHRVKLPKFEEPVVVCRYGLVGVDLMERVVKLLYKYYPYADKTMKVLDEIRPCRYHPRNPDVAVFMYPIRYGSLHFIADGEGTADLVYIYRLDGDSTAVDGVHLELEMYKDKTSVKRVCRLIDAESVLTTLLRALNLPFVSETVNVSV